jgi:hypothetical protein
MTELEVSTVEIRSYRAVFDLERRLYRIDMLRLNPAGVPLRGIAYFAALLLVVLLAARLPLLGGAVRAVPWYARGLIGPAVAAAALTVMRVEGRPFHVAAWALLRFALGPRRLVCLQRPAAGQTRWRPAELLVLEAPAAAGAPAGVDGADGWRAGETR